MVRAAGQRPAHGGGARRKHAGIWEISNPALQRSIVSATFHGRDILAPAAAHLLRGGDPAELGPSRDRFITIRNFEPTADPQGFVGEVIFRDAFGNLITNINADHLGDARARLVGDRDRRRADRGGRSHLWRATHGIVDRLGGQLGLG